MRSLPALASIALLACACDDASDDGSVEAPIVVEDLDGLLHRPLAPRDGAAHVLLFVTVDCPIANGYAPTIKALIEGHGDQPLSFFLVHVDPDVTAEIARSHAVDYGLDGTAPILLDRDHRLVAATGAEITPEAVVRTAAGTVYKGRIDNLWGDIGKRRGRPSQHDLRDALAAVVDGRPVARPWPEPVGCDIPTLW